MTTIVNNPGPGPEHVVERVVETDGGAGWAVAVIILIAVIAVGGYYWVRHRGAPPASPGTNINVTLPAPSSNSGTSNTGY